MASSYSLRREMGASRIGWPPGLSRSFPVPAKEIDFEAPADPVEDDLTGHVPRGKKSDRSVNNSDPGDFLSSLFRRRF